MTAHELAFIKDMVGPRVFEGIEGHIRDSAQVERERCNAILWDAAKKSEALTLVRMDFAVAAERERCAAVVEELFHNGTWPGEFAAHIRANEGAK